MSRSVGEFVRIRCPGSMWLWWIALVWLASVCLALGGCSCNEPVLARVTELSDDVVRDHAASPYAWEPASVGSEFVLGDAVRTGPEASASLDLLPSGRLTVDPVTTVRFSETKQHRGFVLEAGNAMLRSTGDELELYIGDAFSVIHENSEVQVARTEQGVTFLVKVGQALLHTVKGQLTLQAGEGVEISVGLAVLQRFDDDSKEPEVTDDEPDELKPVAPTNVTVSGKTARAKRPDQDAFEELDEGPHDLLSGTRVQLGRGSSAEVAHAGAHADVEQGSQFSYVGAADEWVNLQSGAVKLTTQGPAVAVRVGSAKARTQGPASGVVKSSGKSGLQVQVFSGEIVVETPDGKQEVVAAGETLKIEQGKLVDVVGRSLSFSDLRLPAGAGAVIHDPSPPTALGLGWDGCKRAVVQRLKGRAVVGSAAGDHFASLYFPAGRNDYRILCLGDEGVTDDLVAKGTITVLHDSGTRQLPRTAPHSTVDTDGRRYTVMYQNRLPAITARWPDAPQSGPYQLSVSSTTGRQTYTSQRPSFRLAPGKLREGTHRLRFSAGGVSSPSTSLVVRFDNATPTASIQTPKNAGLSPGQTVQVSGTALSGWSVSAGGQHFNLDGQSRFSGSATFAGSDRAFAIKFSHPRVGTHYYLRHAAGGG